jgi:methyl-accepting chemotaxis protein
MLRLFNNLSFAKKLIGLLLLAGLLPLTIIGLLSYQKAHKELTQQAFRQLESVRDLKADAIRHYFGELERQLQVLAQSQHTLDATESLVSGFQRIKLSPDEIALKREALSQYYTTVFGKAYQAQNPNHSLNFEAQLNAIEPNAIALQQRYISDNPETLGKKHLYRGAEGSPYDSAHYRYHPEFARYLEKFGYYDIFIIDTQGNIVYTVFKELDFATNLKTGPYASSHLAAAYTQALNLATGNSVTVDFKPYTPSYEAAASFMATPIYDGDKLLGVIAMQIPLEFINSIMLQRSGMGQSGESYLVGPDKLMRSDSYLDPKHHSVLASFRDPTKGRVDTQAVALAFAGKTATQEVIDYNGNPVLSAFSPLPVQGLNWAILAEIDQAEAFAGAQHLAQASLIIALISAVALIGFALWVSRLINKPLNLLTQSIKRIEQTGDFSTRIPLQQADEIGQMASAVNELVSNLEKTISATNRNLSALARGEKTDVIANAYQGQLLQLIDGVNQACTDVEMSRNAQRDSERAAKQSAEKAQALAEAAQKQAIEAGIIKRALDVSATAVMIADSHFAISYTNQSLAKMMQTVEAEMRKALPQFDSQQLIGSSIDRFHQNPQQQRQLLQNLTSTHKSDLRIEGLTFDLKASPIRGPQGEFLGTVVEWNNITEQLAKLQAEKAINDTNARIKQALDNSSTATLISDAEDIVIYVNDAMRGLTRQYQPQFNTQIANLSEHSWIGQSLAPLHHQLDGESQSLAARQSAKRQFALKTASFSTQSNPILNADGEMLGRVIEWRDRTQEIQTENEIDDLIKSASNGDFRKVLPLDGKTGFLRTISEGLNRLTSTVNVALEEIVMLFSAMSQGDLTKRIRKDYAGEFAILKSNANTTVDKLNQLLLRIHEAAHNISRNASELSDGTHDLSARTEEQASALEQTAASMEEMTQTLASSEEQARSANGLAQKACDIAIEGDKSVQKSAAAMKAIAEASTKIANIITVIDEIAFQTNLLALNAAVEAARAGEQGRGFAVVANEVRHLAQRSAGAAKEIKQLIMDSTQKVEDGTQLVSHSRSTLQTIVHEVQQVTRMMETIVTSAAEQKTGIGQVNTAVSQMDQMTQQNAALVEEASAASSSMAEEAQAMNQLVSFFKIQ